MFAGIDIGSSSSKVAIVDLKKEILGVKVINLGTGNDVIDDALNELLGEIGITEKDICFSVATGYGRMSYKKADAQITEITCHGKGIATFYPDIRTVIDIGGQDSKVIRLDDGGNIINFVMNEKCAAGTGRFLEVMSRVLAIPLQNLGEVAEKSQNPVTVSSVCTVFAESEVISHLSSGARKEDVARGAHMSVAKRVSGMCGRIDIADAVAMTGGGALNKDLVKCMEAELNRTIKVPAYPQAIGAIGAAIIARDKYLKTIGEKDG